MIGHVPNRPGGTSSEARFMQWVYDLLTGPLRLGDTPNARTCRTTRGSFVIPNPAQGGIQLGLFKLSSLTSDYLVCHTWDGTNEGSEDIPIAKPPKLRCSIDSETIDSVVITY